MNVKLSQQFGRSGAYSAYQRPIVAARVAVFGRSGAYSAYQRPNSWSTFDD